VQISDYRDASSQAADLKIAHIEGGSCPPGLSATARIRHRSALLLQLRTTGTLRLLLRRKDCAGGAPDRVWLASGDLFVGGGATQVNHETKVGPVAARRPPPPDPYGYPDGHDEPPYDWPKPGSQRQHRTSPYSKRGLRRYGEAALRQRPPGSKPSACSLIEQYDR
jgi:hypothetical protein